MSLLSESVKKKQTICKEESTLPMQIVTAQFDYPGKEDYIRLLNALSNSIRKHQPSARFIVRKLKPPVDMITRKKSFASNTVKLEAWVEELEKTDSPTLLMDCDMLVTSSLTSVWNNEFDIAFTYREEGLSRKHGPSYVIENGRRVRKGPKPHPDMPIERGNKTSTRWPPYNGGVMFVRPNKRSIAFMKRQLEINNKMMDDREFHTPWRKLYAGINQAAFGYMIEKEPICKLLPLSCTEWNACDATWLDFNETVKILHVKSALRRYVLGHHQVPKEYEFLVELWKSYESGECLKKN